MQKKSQRDIKIDSNDKKSESDYAEVLPLLALDLKSSNKNLHIPALNRVLNIILKSPECLDEFYNQEMPSVLQRFLSPNEQGEKYVLSTTILHIVGVYEKVTDDVVRANAAIEPLIQIIHSPNEGRSSSACTTLMNLIYNIIIRSSLIQTGFLGIVHHTLALKPEELKKSSSSSEDETVPNHVKLGLLEIVLRLAEIEQDLQPFDDLIPILDELKTNGEGNMKSKAKKILKILNGEGIAASYLSDKEKIDRIRKLEQSNRRLEEENALLKEETEKLKSKRTKDLTMEIINPDTEDIISTPKFNGQLKISKKLSKTNTFSLSQVLENGVYAIEAEFFNSHDGYVMVGVVRDSFQIPAGIHPNLAGCNQHMVGFAGKVWGGVVYYKGSSTPGNTSFADSQIVKAEYDSEKGTLIFFVAGTQQPVCMTGIKEKVRFIIYMYYADSYCIIKSLKNLAIPTLRHVANENFIQW
ncbi:MAG: hypothetical protein EZS28_009297 [Streblomastix strix]|uniref:SPRY domain-containing protein n=1 Tax=Streblomastix strix TaxID=222440 RepID=A0A5J4WJJ6_9EUKA|nr:MAG: hypothetical protein EZS28_009297 [Streblomastix strix]